MTFVKDSYWFKSGIYTILQRITSLVTGFGSFYLLVRILTKSEMGVWALFLTVTALVEVARNGLVQNSLIKYLSNANDEEYPKIFAASLSLNIVTTIFSALLLFIFSKYLAGIWSAPQIELMFYLYIITTLLLIPFSQFNFVQQANLDFKGIFYSNLIRQGVFFGAIVYYYIYHAKFTLSDLVWLQTIGAFLGSIVSYIYVRKYFRMVFALEFEWMKKLFNYGKYVFGTNISSMVFTSIDQLMLGILLPTSAVAVFNAANRVTNFVEVPLSSVASIVFPQSAKRMAVEGTEAITYLYERSVGLLVAMILPVALVCLVFSKSIITIIAGRNYLEAVPILQIIVLVTLLQPYARQFGVVMDSIGKPKTNFYLLVFMALVNIGSNYFFISTFGLIGAAFGTFSALIIFIIISQRILKKEIGAKTHHTFIYAYTFYKDTFILIKQKLFSK